jgi:prepilin signal peptidase PulO-like enzyme (type II secretory pathway)
MRPELALEYSLFILIAAPVIIMDLTEFRIPDFLTLGGLLVLSILKLAFGQTSIGLIALEACLGYGTFWLIHRFTRGRLGLGDAKYSALIAVAVGILPWFVALFVASVAGILFAVVMMGFFGMSRRSRIPFAPFLTLGAIVSVVAGRALPVV